MRIRNKIKESFVTISVNISVTFSKIIFKMWQKFIGVFALQLIGNFFMNINEQFRIQKSGSGSFCPDPASKVLVGTGSPDM